MAKSLNEYVISAAAIGVGILLIWDINTTNNVDKKVDANTTAIETAKTERKAEVKRSTDIDNEGKKEDKEIRSLNSEQIERIHQVELKLQDVQTSLRHLHK